MLLLAGPSSNRTAADASCQADVTAAPNAILGCVRTLPQHRLQESSVTLLNRRGGCTGMAPTLCRDTGYSLTQLIEDIKHGNIALPDIQRPFVWSAAKTRDLFELPHSTSLKGSTPFQARLMTRYMIHSREITKRHMFAQNGRPGFRQHMNWLLQPSLFLGPPIPANVSEQAA
jgi:hypothetical protein